MYSPTPVPERPLPPTVRGLGWTSFLTDFSSEAIYPLLPAFVMRELGGSAMSVGLLDGVANLVTALVRLPSGTLSDRFGRRPLILVGYGLSALVRPLMGLVSTPVGAVFVRAADRFGKGMRTAPRDALVAMLFLLAFPGRERLLFLLSVVPGIVTLLVSAGSSVTRRRPPLLPPARVLRCGSTAANGRSSGVWQSGPSGRRASSFSCCGPRISGCRRPSFRSCGSW